MHLAVNGTRLWFDVEGPALVPGDTGMHERPAVILLHGGPGSYDHTVFRPDFGENLEDVQVIYLDLRAHGRSDRGGEEGWSFEQAADDVRAFCDALGIVRPLMFGHSMGAFIGLLLAARHPGQARALILQGATARFDLPRVVEGFRRRGGDEAAAIAGRFYRGDLSSAADFRARCRGLFGPWVPGDAERSRIVPNEALLLPGLERIRTFHAVDQVGGIDCPVLVLAGELDPVTQVADAREILEALPEGGGRLAVLEGAGHFAWKDAPERFWAEVNGFIGSLRRDPPSLP